MNGPSATTSHSRRAFGASLAIIAGTRPSPFLYFQF